MHRTRWIFLSRNDCQSTSLLPPLPKEGMWFHCCPSYKCDLEELKLFGCLLVFPRSSGSHHWWRRRWCPEGGCQASAGGVCCSVWNWWGLYPVKPECMLLFKRCLVGKINKFSKLILLFNKDTIDKLTVKTFIMLKKISNKFLSIYQYNFILCITVSKNT